MPRKTKSLTHVGDLLPGMEAFHREPSPATEAAVRPATRAASPSAAKAIIDGELIRPEDIAYVHSLYLQCFMPVRHNEKNRQRWETGNRSAKLVIRAGELVKPEDPGSFKQCAVPAGPKARLVVAYIHDYAYRNKTADIDLGRNLHQAMQRMNVSVGGKNGKELIREVENVAAAEIMMSLWMPDGSAHQKTAKVAEDVSFWIEKNPDQQTIWQPTMKLSPRYYASIHESGHMAPIYWPAYIALQHNSRAMDVHAFLNYRLRTIQPGKPVLLRAEVLHAMFGRDIKQLRHFWPHFTKALGEAVEQYPQARHSISVLDDQSGIRLGHAPPLIRQRKVGRIG